MNYPKRLIEVDLPIKRISEHARREKSIRHGHISTLHIWWARRPLAACRAILCASLWPDPADQHCPEQFVEVAQKEMIKWSDNDHLNLLSKESLQHFIKVNHDIEVVYNNTFLRQLLLDFIADFSNWDNSNKVEYLKTSRMLTKSAHQTMGNNPNTKPLMVDPFAGGGAIPLEASRLGCEATASDLNPIAVLLNKAHLELIPDNGKELIDSFLKESSRVLGEVKKKVSFYYQGISNPKIENYLPEIPTIVKKNGISWNFVSIEKEMPIAYVWSRVIKCEGPGCGIEIPLMGTTQLVKKKNKNVYVNIQLSEHTKEIITELTTDEQKIKINNTVRKGSAICPRCGFITKSKSVRIQISKSNGGANNARIIAIISNLRTRRRSNSYIQAFEEVGKYYRNPTSHDKDLITKSKLELKNIGDKKIGQYTLLPKEPTPEGKGSGAGRAFSQRNYGIKEFQQVYTARQLITLSAFAEEIYKSNCSFAVKVFLSLALGRVNDLSMSLCRWLPSLEAIAAANGGQNRMPVTLDFTESNPIGIGGGNWSGQVDWIKRVINNLLDANLTKGNIIQSAAQNQYLPDESVDILFTDPPYYDAFPYSDLSDYFFIWLKRALGHHNFTNSTELVPKEKEIVVYNVEHGEKDVIKDNNYFTEEMTKVFSNWRIASKPNSICVVVFANKTLHGWESILKSIVDSGWIITGSWPINTERENRQRAIGSAALGSSIHLVCRPREKKDDKSIKDQIGDWRDVQAELPNRIHEWMPRLALEGIVGADAIFACLGPALEIYSRYNQVEKPNGNLVTLKEYLEKVWAAVSQEALNMVFSGGEASSFEEDARVTAIWLWTLNTNINEKTFNIEEDIIKEESGLTAQISGYTLEYDTARKIAQGLGANLEELKSLIEIKGDKARLLPVQERTNNLFGTTGLSYHYPRKKKKDSQLSLRFNNMLAEEESEYEVPELKLEKPGNTILDRLHQAMLLFSTGRIAALKRFLVEDEVGKDDRFWKLAQALTALYPKETDERRWVEAIQTYKKSLGF